jgi:Myb-like DNA-binding protein FlbD
MLDPALKRGAWTPVENSTILDLMEKGVGFAEIAGMLPGRSTTDVRNQYKNHIDPSLDKTPLTEMEKSMLKQEVEKYGQNTVRWVEIVKLFPGRRSNQLKNWWNNSKPKKRPLYSAGAVNETAKQSKR